MDFAPERVVPAKPFLTIRDDDEEKACAAYATAGKGEFKNEGKPGWLFLAAAQRASSENFLKPKGGGAGEKSNSVYTGHAKVAIVAGTGDTWEKLVVDQPIEGKVAFLVVKDAAGGPHGFRMVWKKEVVGGKTHLHLNGIDYQSDFVVTKGKDTGRLGGPGQGGAYDRTDDYFLRHRLRRPSNTWEAGGMEFPPEVFIEAFPPGATETTGRRRRDRDHRARVYARVRLPTQVRLLWMAAARVVQLCHELLPDLDLPGGHAQATALRVRHRKRAPLLKAPGGRARGAPRRQPSNLDVVRRQ